MLTFFRDLELSAFLPFSDIRAGMAAKSFPQPCAQLFGLKLSHLFIIFNSYTSTAIFTGYPHASFFTIVPARPQIAN
jgi:hypothetical protein